MEAILSAIGMNLSRLDGGALPSVQVHIELQQKRPFQRFATFKEDREFLPANCFPQRLKILVFKRAVGHPRVTTTYRQPCAPSFEQFVK